MTLIVDGTNGLTFPNSTVQASAGTVLQVVSTTLSSTFTSSTNYAWLDITGLSVSITPKFANSKILCTYVVSGAIFRPAQNGVNLRATRNGTAVGVGDASGSIRQQGSSSAIVSNDSIQTASWQYLDTPATTSSLTYQVQIYQDTSANPFYINRSVDNSVQGGRSISTITVMEIAG